jgi:hypothetical protein
MSHRFEQLDLGSAEIIEATASSQNSIEYSLPASPPERVRKAPSQALQHTLMAVTIHLDKTIAFDAPLLISAFECNTLLKLLLSIKNGYGRQQWHELPATTTTDAVLLECPGQEESCRVSSVRVYSDWYNTLGLFVLDRPDKKIEPKIVVLLRTTEDIQNCFFTDGDLDVSQDRAAMNEALGIGQENGDWTVICSGRYLRGLEHNEEVKGAEIAVKDKEIESLRRQLRDKEAENRWLKSLVEGEEVEEQQEQPARMSVGGMSLPRY